MNTENPFPRLKLASSVKQGQYSSNVSEKKVKKIKLFPSSHKPNTAGQYTFYAAIKSQSGQHKNKKVVLKASESDPPCPGQWNI
ncbi:TPA: hypothetical protein R4B11_002888 [Salmonella enterica subsp. enterica serovar Potsdam]|nr:hypothetical protein [Salmonella enterica]EHO8673577.1 hypothetical protein [Salmonella enterica]HEC8060730.1 hypothetical protein [Salmonella enterica subsp. enterica serovar Potsdam]